MERFKMIASGYVLFIKEGSILLQLRQNTGYEDGNYGLPAGHIEDNETITNGALREIREEVGVSLAPNDVELIHVMQRKEHDIRMDFFFVTKKWHKEPTNMEPHKCKEIVWFPLDQLPQNIIGYIKIAIENYQQKLFYSEVGW